MPCSRETSLDPMFLRYDQERFRDLAYLALRRNFRSRSAFDRFLDSLGTEHQSKFLFLATQYFLLVKCAKLSFTFSDIRIDTKCLNATYKYIALFSLMEAVQTEAYEEFPTHLLKRKNRAIYPIENCQAMQDIFDGYNSKHGATKKVNRFLQSLSTTVRRRLSQRVSINSKRTSIKNIANFLYQVRSNFIHQAQLVLVVNNSPIYGATQNFVYKSRLRLSDLSSAFEKGLIGHFRQAGAKSMGA